MEINKGRIVYLLFNTIQNIISNFNFNRYKIIYNSDADTSGNVLMYKYHDACLGIFKEHFFYN